MTEEQADQIIELLKGIKDSLDELSDINSELGSIKNAVDAGNTTLEQIRKGVDNLDRR